jgi:NAD+ synthase (glutamine-hydrolysing)
LHGEIDIDKIMHDRNWNKSFSRAKRPCQPYQIHELPFTSSLSDIKRVFSQNPFVPRNSQEIHTRMEEILEIQSTGLQRRLMSTGGNVVLGISGGLDSTLALLVCVKTFAKMAKDCEQIFAISMPGPGTTDQTKNSARCLAEALGVSFREIDISKAVAQHLEDLEHNKAQHDVVFENAQARERTQILFNLANKYQSIVVGTGDLSELALGWCTYNGDQNSSYNVNISIPKTLVQHLISYIADTSSPKLQQILQEILRTPISPELLPPDQQGKIQQKTEDIIGPYVLHDFFLFYYVRCGFSVEKILAMAQRTFSQEYSQQKIREVLQLFLRRFHQQQFKRTCSPPGPKVGTLTLSPRGDWRMPDEVSRFSRMFQETQ